MNEPLPRHQRVLIDLAFRVLRAAMVRSGDVRVDGIEVHIALPCLFHHCPESWPLALLRDAAGQENDIGRAKGCTAAFNGVVRQLRRACCYPKS